MTLVLATLLEKKSFSEEDFLVRRDEMYQWIAQMTQFEGTDGTGNCNLPLGHGCRALSNILSIPRCEDFVSADCRLNIITTIVEGLEYVPEWGANDLEDMGQTILHCCLGVPTLPFQRALVAAIHTLWEQNQVRCHFSNLATVSITVQQVHCRLKSRTSSNGKNWQ